MPGLSLQTDAFVLRRRPPAEKFVTLTVFSPVDGALTVLERVAGGKPGAPAPLDLFDEASLVLESSNQRQSWFLREARVIARHASIGRDYDSLRHASAFAAAVARNPVPEESRRAVGDLLRAAFKAFAEADRADIVRFKSLYRFARDEGHPVSQQWLAELPARDRRPAESLLAEPVARLDLEPPEVARILASLEDYLRGNAEMLLE